MSDYDVLHDYAVGPKPERRTEDDTNSHAHETATRAVQHNRPEALGAGGAAHLQRLAGNAATSALVAQREEDPNLVHQVIGSGGGSALDDGTRASMEKSFGADFSSVRIHSGSQAAAAAKSVQAHAFTVGDNIVMGEGKSPSDTRTLAHELTHVVQQRSGDVPGESIGNGIKLSDPGDWAERQAEATADKVISSQSSPAAGHDHAAPAAGAAGVQREAAAQEEEPLQGSFVQREAAADEEAVEEDPAQGEFIQREAAGDDEIAEEEAPA